MPAWNIGKVMTIITLCGLSFVQQLCGKDHDHVTKCIVQCNLEYLDLVYLDPRLSRLTEDHIATHVQNAWLMIFCVHGHRLSDELWTLQTCLGLN